MKELENKELISKLEAAVGVEVVRALTQRECFFKSGRVNRSACARALGVGVKEFDRLFEQMQLVLKDSD